MCVIEGIPSARGSIPLQSGEESRTLDEGRVRQSIFCKFISIFSIITRRPVRLMLPVGSCCVVCVKFLSLCKHRPVWTVPLRAQPRIDIKWPGHHRQSPSTTTSFAPLTANPQSHWSPPLWISQRSLSVIGSGRDSIGIVRLLGRPLSLYAICVLHPPR